MRASRLFWTAFSCLVLSTPPDGQDPPNRPAANQYVHRARLRPQLREALRSVGDRLERPGKERLTLIGTLTRSVATAPEILPVRLFLQLPDRMRLEEQIGTRVRISIFDGRNLVKTGGPLSQTDVDLAETLVFDSTDHFFLGQAQGLATRFLGNRFRPDDGRTPKYGGPFFDLYQVTDLIPAGQTVRRQPKAYGLNSDTLRLERVQYEIVRAGGAVKVEVQVTNWQSVAGQLVPGKITRTENGAPVLTFVFTSASLGASLPDGIFTNP